MTSHLFTQMGLGEAPFKIVNYTEKSTGCAYCGRSIKRVSVVMSADGIKSNIGCECIKKAGDSGLIYDSMYAKWANHPWINKSLEGDKEAFLTEMQRVMIEVANESQP